MASFAQLHETAPTILSTPNSDSTQIPYGMLSDRYVPYLGPYNTHMLEPETTTTMNYHTYI